MSAHAGPGTTQPDPSETPHRLSPYDAVLLVSFGGPERPEDVRPFLRRVAAGRDIPESRLEEVAQHYLDRGGVSPINAETRALAAALRASLAARGMYLPVVWGTRNAAPFLEDAMAGLVADGARSVVTITTSAYPGYSSCRQYRENLHDARAEAGGPERVDRVRSYAHHPGFVAAYTDLVLRTLQDASPEARLVFVTHSIPVSMAATSGPEPRSEDGSYVEWHELVAATVAERVEVRTGQPRPWTLAYCSRSGRPQTPWLEPDINDALEHLAGDGVREVVLVPIGFVADHMEVVNDLDHEAVETGRRLGITVRRVPTVQLHPEFVAALVDLLVERAAVARGEQVMPEVIDHGSPGRYECPEGCCPNPRDPGRPSLCGAQDPEPAPGGGPLRPRSGQVWTTEPEEQG